MKKRMLALVAVFGVSLVALAQGSINLANELVPHGGLAVDNPGNYYVGTFGMEVWELNSTSIPAGINVSAASGAGVLSYAAVVAAGFAKETTYAKQTTVSPGVFDLGRENMPNVSPVGVTVVVALAVWTTSDPSWSAMLANANQTTRAGVLAFVQPTANESGLPPVLPNLAMTQDLVMTSVPEPGAFPLTGLGASVAFILRRRCALKVRGTQHEE
jgi:hypothetical protein